MPSFTQPQCSRCWYKAHPYRPPTVVKEQYATAERCCMCGQPTSEGIWIRIDPKTVPFPKEA